MAATTAVLRGRERAREREREKTRVRVGHRQIILISCRTRPGTVQGSISVPLFQLKELKTIVSPQLGGPPICLGPYAPAYATPLSYTLSSFVTQSHWMFRY